MISTQLNITFISYFVKKNNCISVLHRFYSKSVYVLHFELRSFAAVPSGGLDEHSLEPTNEFRNAPGSVPSTNTRSPTYQLP